MYLFLRRVGMTLCVGVGVRVGVSGGAGGSWILAPPTPHTLPGFMALFMEIDHKNVTNLRIIYALKRSVIHSFIHSFFLSFFH